MDFLGNKKMQCEIRFLCECNQKTYPSKQSLSAHQKTQTHLRWVERNELRQLKMDLTEKTNTKITLLKDLNNQLIRRITAFDV